MQAFNDKAVTSSVGKNSFVKEYELLLELAFGTGGRKRKMQIDGMREQSDFGGVVRSVLICDKIDQIAYVYLICFEEVWPDHVDVV